MFWDGMFWCSVMLQTCGYHQKWRQHRVDTIRNGENIVWISSGLARTSKWRRQAKGNHNFDVLTRTRKGVVCRIIVGLNKNYVVYIYYVCMSYTSCIMCYTLCYTHRLLTFLSILWLHIMCFTHTHTLNTFAVFLDSATIFLFWPAQEKVQCFPGVNICKAMCIMRLTLNTSYGNTDENSATWVTRLSEASYWYPSKLKHFIRYFVEDSSPFSNYLS